MESYEFELWAQLPEDEKLNIEADEVADVVELDLTEEQVSAVVEMLKNSGMETSVELVEEQMPELHAQLWAAAELLARKYMLVRKFVNNQYAVDEEDLFEEDYRNGVFEYSRNEDVDGGVDDEEGYADALYAWQQWEMERVMAMDSKSCVDYLTSRYHIQPEMEDVDYGYRLPDELAAEAMAAAFGM